jgi:preprotein translocase subunit SecD
MGPSKSFASDILKYSICQNNIAKAFVYSQDDYHAVDIQLTPKATEEFSKLTKENIGRRLEILFKNEVVLSAIIMDKIGSGGIRLNAMSEKEANKLLNNILNHVPEQPCGIMYQ